MRVPKKILLPLISFSIISVASAAATSSAASDPSPQATFARPDQKLLDTMMGDWDVDYASYGEDGKVTHYAGTAQFTNILEGAAIQEIWTSDYKGRKAQPYGTTIEFYDGKRKQWTATWIYPAQGSHYSVAGGEIDGRLVLTGVDQEGVLQRWSSQDFAVDSFRGRFEVSKDGGKTWRLVGINQMTRHKAN